jgi:hypothetical protein
VLGPFGCPQGLLRRDPGESISIDLICGWQNRGFDRVNVDIEITATSRYKSQHNLHDARKIELTQPIFVKAAPTENHAMKTSSLVSLICCLTINGINSCYQPAVARSLPQPKHIAEALTSARQSADETDKFVVVRESEKYGYGDVEDSEITETKFDNTYKFFNGLAAIKIDGKHDR